MGRESDRRAAATDPAPGRASWAAAAAAARGLLVLHDVARRPPVANLIATASVIGARDATAGSVYAALWRDVATAGTGLHVAVARAIATSENVLGAAARPPGTGHLDADVRRAVAHDLRAIARLVRLADHLPDAVRRATGHRPPPLPAGDGRRAPGSLVAPCWDDLVGADGVARLAAHHARHGGGHFARARAFAWTGAPAGDAVAGFDPVASPDDVHAADLVGSFEARLLLRRNTANLLRGAPANNVLLYGDRGTGKSSSVKSLLNEPAPEAWGDAVDAVADAAIPWHLLRVVEVPKGRLADFPAIAATLRDRRERFVVFVDDLSFEDGETQYKDLKALLDGGLAARPANVVVYATSNRRHLVREQFTDRPDPLNSDVHGQDTVQEKLSFADRFGLTLTFTTPSMEEYVAIATHLAHRRGLPVAPPEVRRRAITWAAWHNGRSGRTARQFIDDLTAEMG